MSVNTFCGKKMFRILILSVISDNDLDLVDTLGNSQYFTYKWGKIFF